MGLRRQEGEFDILYWSRFEPTSGTDPRQNPANYSRVGLLADLSDEVSNDTQSTLDRASTQHESVIYGQQSSSASLTCNVQKTRTEDATLSGDPTVSSASAGVNTLTVNTDTDDSIDLSSGDMIGLGSHPHHYIVRSSLSLSASSSGTIDIAPRLQEDIGGGNNVSIKEQGEDPVQQVLKESANSQRNGYLLIVPEDDTGAVVSGLEGVHARSVIESISTSRNAGEFKQLDVSVTNKIAPTYFTT